MKSGKIKTKSKAVISEAVDIIKNSENDKDAIAFLRDTLEDDFPDMDLGRMDLHQAIDELDFSLERRKKSKSVRAIEDLNKSLGDFLDKQEKKVNEIKKKASAKKKKSTKKPSKKSTK